VRNKHTNTKTIHSELVTLPLSCVLKPLVREAEDSYVQQHSQV